VTLCQAACCFSALIFVLESRGAILPASFSNSFLADSHLQGFRSYFLQQLLASKQPSALGVSILGALHHQYFSTYYTYYTTSQTWSSRTAMFPPSKLKPKLLVKKPQQPVENEAQKPAAGLPYASILKRYCRRFSCFAPPTLSPFVSSSRRLEVEEY